MVDDIPEYDGVAGRDVNDGHSTMTTQMKLQLVLDALREVKWSFHQFLLAWAGIRVGSRDVQLEHSSYRTVQQRRDVLICAIAHLEEEGVRVSSAVDQLEKELDSLIQQPYFGRFEPTVNIETVDFNEAFETIERFAPNWHHLLVLLLSNQRSHRESYGGTGEFVGTLLPNRVYAITSMVLHSRAKRRSNFFPAMLALYLLGSGTKRRVIECLSKLGITHGYHQANRNMNDVADRAASQLKSLAADPQAVIVYDNMNFKDTKRDEVAGHTSGMVSMTTAAIIHCPELPPSGLHQSMHNPTIPLSTGDIFEAPGISGDDNGINSAISRGLIADAIKRLHPSAVNAVFCGNEDYPKVPCLETIRTNKTSFWQLGAIFEDEGTISGTYHVHENIFLKQFGLQAPKDPTSDTRDDFRDRLWLVHGDQLTTQYIRAVKAEQSRAKRSYDRRDWMLGIPSWFHIQMNLLNTIVRTHWSPALPNEQAHHCLKADITTWNRSCSSRTNVKYHQIEPLVIQSFTARVAALFYAAMRRHGYITSLQGDDALSIVSNAIQGLTSRQFTELVEDVRLSAFTLQAWRGTTHKDVEFRTMCRMLQEMELFLSVRHAVKHADIGLLRRLVDPLIVVFLGAAQHKYGMEMLFYRWNLSPVNSPELQHAILASGLVNWPGRPTTHKPIDLGLEHLNGSCKIDMKCYKNSTHDLDITFNRVCLSNTWVRALRAKVEGTFGEDMPGHHTIADAALDIFLLAQMLFTGDLAEPRDADQLVGLVGLFDSSDIFDVGMRALSRNVGIFNQHHVRRPQGFIPVPYPSEHSSDYADDGFLDIVEYAANAGEELDTILEPLLDVGVCRSL